MKFTIRIDKQAQEEIIAIVHAPSALTDQIGEWVSRYCGEEYLLGIREDEVYRLAFSQIECITILNRKVIAIDRQAKQYVLRERLRDLEAILPDSFIRIHKSALANEFCILAFEPAFSGGVDALFRCGHREYVSRRCFAEIKRRYENL